tara:strand:+ start:840 stop:1061 length:222 start_codon:yes stop_codon:yes gene_type:complete
MKFNHLLPDRVAHETCDGTDRQHYWRPVSINASQGGYMSITFVCKNCKKRTGEFLTNEQYTLHAAKLERECEL